MLVLIIFYLAADSGVHSSIQRQVSKRFIVIIANGGNAEAAVVLEEVGHDRKAVLAEVVPNSFALAAVVQTEDPNIAPMEVQMCTVVDH